MCFVQLVSNCPQPFSNNSYCFLLILYVGDFDITKIIYFYNLHDVFMFLLHCYNYLNLHVTASYVESKCIDTKFSFNRPLYIHTEIYMSISNVLIRLDTSNCVSSLMPYCPGYSCINCYMVRQVNEPLQPAACGKSLIIDSWKINMCMLYLHPLVW